jgi:hypothetical protein
MSTQLLKHTAQDNAIFYKAATNVSSATPTAVAHFAWDRPRRVRISLRAEACLHIGHDDAIGAPLLKANGGR